MSFGEKEAISDDNITLIGCLVNLIRLFVSKTNKKCLKTETRSLVEAYEQIDFYSPSLQLFFEEVYRTIRSNIPLTEDSSFLDFGCGKGFFLKYLKLHGFKYLQGVEPDSEFRDKSLIDNVIDGSYEENTFNSNSFDIVFTCHTIHHLSNKYPLYAIKELLRITRRYIVILEINNTNIPMLFRSLYYLHREANAFRYNLARVRSLLVDLECLVVYSNYLKSGYLSGNSFIHKILAKVGMPPYNISIVVKQ